MVGSELEALRRLAVNTAGAVLLCGLGFAMMGGCGKDPILERAEQEAKKLGSGQPGQPPPGKPGEPPPGKPGEPPPGEPGEPPPGGEVQGPAVQFRGIVKMADWKSGTLRVEVFDGDQQQAQGKRVNLVAFTQIEAPGAFVLQVPQTSDWVWVGASVDEDGDGRPGPLEPAGWFSDNPVSTEEDRRGLILELKRRAPPDDKTGLDR